MPHRTSPHSEPRLHVREASMQTMLDQEFGSSRGEDLGSESPGSDPLEE